MVELADARRPITRSSAIRVAALGERAVPQQVRQAVVMGKVVVVSGACGVGKSAAVRRLPYEAGRAVGEVAVMETDDFYMMVDPAWTLPEERVERLFALTGWLLQETALGFLHAGLAVVAIASNGLWQEHRAREFARRFQDEGFDVHHTSLDLDSQQLRARLRARAAERGGALDDSTTSTLTQMLVDVRAAFGPWTHVIDVGDLTPTATAAAITEAITAGNGKLDR